MRAAPSSVRRKALSHLTGEELLLLRILLTFESLM